MAEAPPSAGSSDRLLDRSAVVATLAWRFLLVAAVVAVVAWVVSRLYLATVPLFLAAIVASVVSPPVRWLKGHGWRPAPSALAVLLAVLLVVVAVFAVIVPRFAGEVTELRLSLTGAVDRLQDALPGLWPGGGQGETAEGIAQLDLQDRITGYLDDHVGQVLNATVLVAQILAGVLLTVTFTFFMVKDESSISAWARRKVPADHRDAMTTAGAAAWDTLGGYFRGVLIIAAVDAIGVGIGLFVLGVPLIFSLMVLIFVGAFFPVVGAFLSGLVAVGVAFVDGGFTAALWVLGILVVVQQIEGNVLQPMVMRRTVQLHPIVTLFALTAGGALGGIAGAFLAVPLVAVTSTAVSTYVTARSAATGRPLPAARR